MTTTMADLCQTLPEVMAQLGVSLERLVTRMAVTPERAHCWINVGAKVRPRFEFGAPAAVEAWWREVGRREAEAREAMGEGFVYAIAADRSDIVKVGFSVDPQSRLGTLQTSTFHELVLLRQWRGSMVLERRLHGVLERRLVRGEWYRGRDIVVRTVDGVVEDSLLKRVARAWS